MSCEVLPFVSGKNIGNHVSRAEEEQLNLTLEQGALKRLVESRLCGGSPAYDKVAIGHRA